MFVGESELPRANEGTTVFSLTRLQIIYTSGRGYSWYTLLPIGCSLCCKPNFLWQGYILHICTCGYSLFMMYTQFCMLPFSKVFQCRFYILWKEMIRNVLNFCFQPYATKVCYTLLHCAFLTDTPLTRSWKLQTKFFPIHSPLICFLTAFSSNTYFLQKCFVSIYSAKPPFFYQSPSL